MIDVSQLQYGLKIITDTNTLDLSSVFQGLSWESAKAELADRAQFRVPNVNTSAGWLSSLLALGNKCSIFAGAPTLKEQLRGTHFRWEYSDDETETIDITAYDDLYYLQVSKDHVIINNGDGAADVLRKILTDWGFVIGRFDITNTQLPPVKFRGSIGDLIAQILGEVFYGGDGAFLLRMNYSTPVATVDVIRPGENSVVYAFSGSQYESVKDIQDITQLITVVRVASDVAGPVPDDAGATEIPDTVEPPVDESLTSSLLNTYGRLQDILVANASESADTVHRKAQNILDEHGNPHREKQVVLPDVPDVHKGDIHRFINVGTLNGYYLISGVSHDAVNGKMTVNIDASGTTDYQHLRVSADKAFVVPDKPL